MEILTSLRHYFTTFLERLSIMENHSNHLQGGKIGLAPQENRLHPHNPQSN